jgi:hypothetical protein
MSDHVITVPDRIWEWAQRKSGKSIPAGFLRDVLYGAWADDLEATHHPIATVNGAVLQVEG